MNAPNISCLSVSSQSPLKPDLTDSDISPLDSLMPGWKSLPPPLATLCGIHTSPAPSSSPRFPPPCVPSLSPLPQQLQPPPAISCFQQDGSDPSFENFSTSSHCHTAGEKPESPAPFKGDCHSSVDLLPTCLPNYLHAYLTDNQQKAFQTEAEAQNKEHLNQPLKGMNGSANRNRTNYGTSRLTEAAGEEPCTAR